MLKTQIVCPVGVALARKLSHDLMVNMGYSPVWTPTNEANARFLETDLASPTHWAEVAREFQDDVQTLVTFNQDEADAFIEKVGMKSFKVECGVDQFVSLAFLKVALAWVEANLTTFYVQDRDAGGYVDYPGVKFQPGTYSVQGDVENGPAYSVSITTKNGDIIIYTKFKQEPEIADPLELANLGIQVAAQNTPTRVRPGSAELTIPMTDVDEETKLEFLIGLTNGKATVIDAAQRTKLAVDEEGVTVESITQETCVLEAICYKEVITMSPPFHMTIVRPSVSEVPILSGWITKDVCKDPNGRTLEQIRNLINGIEETTEEDTGALEYAEPTWPEPVVVERADLYASVGPDEGLEGLVVS